MKMLAFKSLKSKSFRSEMSLLSMLRHSDSTSSEMEGIAWQISIHPPTISSGGQGIVNWLRSSGPFLWNVKLGRWGGWVTDDRVKKTQDDSICEWKEKESRQAREFPSYYKCWRAQIEAQISLVRVPASKQTLNMEMFSKETSNSPFPFFSLPTVFLIWMWSPLLK